MQIDFHHAVTYVVARIAGFSPDDAGVIAYAAQYVDDATVSGVVCFDNKSMYQRLSSAHKTIDLANLRDTENHVVWLPFHFLPGNCNLPAGTSAGTFVQRCVCVAGSPVAEDMVAVAIADKNKPYGLHRLGLTMHVYADTWAHQGFAGMLDPINDVDDARESGKSGVFSGDLTRFLLDHVENKVPPLGHGRANVLPDMPFLQWQYKNGSGVVVVRKNDSIFCMAANALCMAMRRYQLGNPTAVVPGLPPADLAAMKQMFLQTTQEDGDVRHQAWCFAIASGTFSFGPEAAPKYDAEGDQSWKADALGSSCDLPVTPYTPAFLSSNWKMFHDAAQAHRLTVLREILPRYGICAG